MVMPCSIIINRYVEILKIVYSHHFTRISRQAKIENVRITVLNVVAGESVITNVDTAYFPNIQYHKLSKKIIMNIIAEIHIKEK